MNPEHYLSVRPILGLEEVEVVTEWSTLIGPDCRDTVLSLVEPYYAGAKVYAITTHLKA